MLCLCNFGSWCGESRDQIRILPVGRRPARREGATVPDSDKTQHLLLLPSDRVQKQLAKVTPLAEQVTASRTVTVTHLHFQNTHPHTHTYFRARLCPPKSSSVICAHTYLKTDAWLLVCYFRSSQRSYINLTQLESVFYRMMSNLQVSVWNMPKVGVPLKLEETNLEFCGCVVLFICSMFYEKVVYMACVPFQVFGSHTSNV